MVVAVPDEEAGGGVRLIDGTVLNVFAVFGKANVEEGRGRGREELVLLDVVVDVGGKNGK